MTEDQQAYYCNETWFELKNIEKLAGDGSPMLLKGKRIINSYGKVREVWEDGTYQDIALGKELGSNPQ